KVRPLPPAEVHLLWARLRSWRRDEDVARVAADLQQAQKLGGDSAELELWMARLELHTRAIDSAADRLARAVKLWPESAELLSDYIGALHAREEQRAATARDFRALAPLAQRLAALDGP